MELVKNYNKNKIFVYDTSRGFCRFVKLNFENDYSIDSCYKKEQFDNFFKILPYYHNYLFVINNYEDILNLMKLCTKKETILLVIMIKELEDKFDNFDNIIRLDLNQTKKDTIKFLNNYLTLHIAE